MIIRFGYAIWYSKILTKHIKCIDYSYYYEGYTTFKAEELL